MNLILVDIDGTIADMRHRRHFLLQEKADWKSFYEAMVHDKPIYPVIDLANQAYYRDEVYYWTGRPATYANETLWWFGQHEVEHDKLIMRKEGDFRPDWQVKQDMLNEMKWKPDLVIDDKQEVVDMVRRNGIICLQKSMKELPE